MLEPYDGKLSRTVLRREGGGNTADPADYSPLVNRLKGQVIKISPNSTQFINPMDINANYSEEDNPLSLKADFILSLCELVVGGKEGLLPVEKTVIDRCVHLIYRKYFANPCPENMPILEDLYNALLQQDEKEAHHVATALEIYVKGSLNLFNHRTNVNVNNRIVCYDIKELGKQMKKLGMLIVQDQVWGRVTANRSSGKSTRYYMDEMHLLLKEEQTAAYALMKNKIIGICPNCGANVVEREKGWFCENRECRFVLWKDNAFFKRLGKRLDAHVADKLLRDGRVRLKDCKSAKGKTYNATVLLGTEPDGRSRFSLEFEGGC